MKVLFFLVISLITQISFGQDLIRRVDHIDEFTGVKEIETNAIWVASRGNFLNGGNLRFEMGRYFLKEDSLESYALRVVSSDILGCAGSDRNYIHFLFEDGNSVKYVNDKGRLSCKDYSESVYIINENDFVDKNINKVRYCQSEGCQDYKWTSLVSLDAFFAILK